MKKDWDYGVLEDAVKKGSSNISLNKVKNDEGEYPLFSAKGFNKNISFFQQEKEYLGIIKDGAGIGRVSKHPAKSSIVATMQYLIPKDGFDIGFVEYFLNGVDFEKHRNGSTIPHIYFKDYKSERFPLLELPEQKRIVAILDSAFEVIDQAKANAEQNLQNAKELFESYLNHIFEEKGEDWEEKKLNEVVIETCNLSYGVVQPGNDFENGLPVVRPVDLKSKYINKDRVKLMNPVNAEKYKRTTLQGNELLLCVRGDTGVIGLITNDFKGANVTRGIVPISFDENKISLEFGYYSFISPFFQKQIKDKTYGAALMQINIRDVRQLLMIIPPLKKQKQIVQKLDKLSAETKKLELVYQQKLEDLEDLKKSILQKAFNGEL